MPLVNRLMPLTTSTRKNAINYTKIQLEQFFIQGHDICYVGGGGGLCKYDMTEPIPKHQQQNPLISINNPGISTDGRRISMYNPWVSIRLSIWTCMDYPWVSMVAMDVRGLSMDID